MSPIEKIDLHLFGSRLRAAREIRNLTQAELGERVGLSKGSISKYENGVVEELDLNLLARFTQALEVDVNDLICLRSSAHEDTSNSYMVAEDAAEYGLKNTDTNTLLEMLKNDPTLRMVAKIQGELTEEGKRDLLKYAELLRNQRDSKWND